MKMRFENKGGSDLYADLKGNVRTFFFSEDVFIIDFILMNILRRCFILMQKEIRGIFCLFLS